MPERLITDVNATEVLKNGTKTTANIFEAYVAGLHYSYLKHGEVFKEHPGVTVLTFFTNRQYERR